MNRSHAARTISAILMVSLLAPVFAHAGALRRRGKGQGLVAKAPVHYSNGVQAREHYRADGRLAKVELLRGNTVVGAIEAQANGTITKNENPVKAGERSFLSAVYTSDTDTTQATLSVDHFSGGHLTEVKGDWIAREVRVLSSDVSMVREGSDLTIRRRNGAKFKTEKHKDVASGIFSVDDNGRSSFVAIKEGRDRQVKVTSTGVEEAKLQRGGKFLRLGAKIAVEIRSNDGTVTRERRRWNGSGRAPGQFGKNDGQANPDDYQTTAIALRTPEKGVVKTRRFLWDKKRKTRRLTKISTETRHDGGRTLTTARDQLVVAAASVGQNRSWSSAYAWGDPSARSAQTGSRRGQFVLASAASSAATAVAAAAFAKGTTTIFEHSRSTAKTTTFEPAPTVTSLTAVDGMIVSTHETAGHEGSGRDPVRVLQIAPVSAGAPSGNARRDDFFGDRGGPPGDLVLTGRK